MRELKLLTQTSGSTAIEYALIAGGIALVIIVTVTAIGGEISAILQELSDQFSG